MKNMMLIATGANNSLDYIRANTVLSVVVRLKKLADQEYLIPRADAPQLVKAISKLTQQGRLSFEIGENIITVKYVPSFEAKKQLVDHSINKDWDETIIKKQQKAIRTTQGALFKLPLEKGEGTIDTFITDWSPFPVATAIAVHKDHPAIADTKQGKANYFTGRFVRHPLMGDLIPVFVADWVKPEFGSGAVIVNPAHNQSDLDFARNIGLPIRFGLIPHEVTADPATWLTAPVIKIGHTTKTGRFDNLIPEIAANKYFDELTEHGHAIRFTDIGIGAYPLFELNVSDDGEYAFNSITSELMQISDEQEISAESAKVSLISSPILDSIIAADMAGEFELVTQSSEIERTLLFTRCLTFDLNGTTLVPERIIQVQKVQEAKSIENVDPVTLSLAVIIQAPNNQISILKQQILEQTERFVKNHSEIKDRIATTPTEEKAVDKWQYVKIKDLILNANYQNAFNSLYAIQKNLLQSINRGAADINAIRLYFALVYVLLGDDYPDGFSIDKIWSTL
jgi:hypothetical protein